MSENGAASELKVRVGIPTRGGALLAAARARNYPVLLSANAFAKYHKTGPKEGYFKGFAEPDPIQFAGVDAALDSAGFVAMAHYRDYPWTIDQYLDLATSFDWAWYAAPDYCCEEEVAADRITRRLRCAATISGYYHCARLAADRGMKPPLAVIQGQWIDDYLWSLDRLPVEEGMLLGVGSVCRREVHGPRGIVAVVDALDRVLPAGCRLHLFGVKSNALSYLAGHPRIESTDSCAWDAAARRERPTGRTQDFRVTKMEEWVRSQSRRLAMPTAMQRSLFDPEETVDETPAELAELEQWCGLIADGEYDYKAAIMHIDHYGLLPLDEIDADSAAEGDESLEALELLEAA